MTPLQIGIDLFPLVPAIGRGGGFHRYAVELVRALDRLDDEHRYTLFVSRRNAHLFPTNDRFSHVVSALPPAREFWPVRLAWQHVVLPREARRLRLDVLHSPFDTAPLRVPCASVVTVHDLITDVFYPTRFPRDVSFLKARYLHYAKRHAARHASAVICVSRATADDVVRHYNLPRSAVRVVPHGANPSSEAPAGEALPRSAPLVPYILAVVSLSPHKNVAGLLEAFRLARERFSLPHELHVVGMPGIGAEGVQRALDAATAAGLPVQTLGYVDEPTLHAEYTGASLLAFVPLVEGFGLPALEAMAHGVPVVASRVRSVAEVCGEAALLVDPEDPREVADAIGRAVTDARLAEQLRQAGRARARSYTWDATARATRDVYELAARTGGP